ERALGALRDFTRRDILLRFYADRKARSVEDVSREAGVHRSVAFEHLERLVALGYLEVAHRRGLPGKPAKIYKLTGGPVQISHPMRRYDIVAESLGRAFDELGDVGSHAVRRAGRNFGESIASGGARSAMAALEPMLEMGAEYEMDRGGIIQCNNCLFAEVCRRAPVIFRFHAGILDGLFMPLLGYAIAATRAAEQDPSQGPPAWRMSASLLTDGFWTALAVLLTLLPFAIAWDPLSSAFFNAGASPTRDPAMSGIYAHVI